MANDRPDLFKVIVVEYWLNHGTDQARRVSKDTPDAAPLRKKSRKWYAWIGGKRVPLSPNKEAARILLGEKTRKAALADAGARDPSRPITSGRCPSTLPTTSET